MHPDVRPSDQSSRPSSGSGGRSIVAVVGIDRYEAWPPLDNAVNDALGAARIFMQLGFVEVSKPLIDGAATEEAMRHLVIDELAQLAPEDSLVLFFAGHGYTHTAQFGDVSVKTGYMIPVDAAPSRGQPAASWLRLDAWLSDIARLPPRHILVMLDACHSGVALTAQHKWRDTGTAPRGELAALQARRSRRVIASALDDQRAMDGGPYPGHSLFTGCLIEGLSGGLLEDGQRAATGREIGLYIQRRVRSYPHTTQTPDFGAFELDDRGDIVVPILGSEAVSTAAEPTFLVDWSQLSGTPRDAGPKSAVAQPVESTLTYGAVSDQNGTSAVQKSGETTQGIDDPIQRARVLEKAMAPQPSWGDAVVPAATLRVENWPSRPLDEATLQPPEVPSMGSSTMATLLTRQPPPGANTTLMTQRPRVVLVITIAGFTVVTAAFAIATISAGKQAAPAPAQPPTPNQPLPTPTDRPPTTTLAPPSAPMLSSPDSRAQVALVIKDALVRFVRWSQIHPGAPCPDAVVLDAPSDPWGHRLAITCTDQPDDQIVGAVSAGPDGTRGSADDIASWQLGGEVTVLVHGQHWPAAAPASTAKPQVPLPPVHAQVKRFDVSEKPSPPMLLDKNGVPIKR